MYRKENNNKVEWSVRPVTDPLNSAVFNPSVLSDLTIQEYSSDDSLHIASDIDVLIMQQDYLSRHPELSEDFMKAAMSNMSAKDPNADLKSKVSDEDIMNYIKSRHIQSPAELKMWSDYLVDEFTDAKLQVDNIIKESQITETETETE